MGGWYLGRENKDRWKGRLLDLGTLSPALHSCSLARASSPLPPQRSTPQVWRVTFPEQTSWVQAQRDIAELASHKRYVPEPALFWKLLPFHLVLDQELKIVQVRQGGRRGSPREGA